MAAQLVDAVPEQLKTIESLYEQGLFVKAYAAARQLGPLESWRGADALLMAGRLAEQLGGSILGRWFIRRAWYEDPAHGLARCYYASRVARSRGPYAAWRFMHEAGPPRGDQPEVAQADWWAMAGGLAAMLRDFDTADDYLARALALKVDRPWIEVCQASILQWEDRYDEALAVALQVLDHQPLYPPAVGCAAHLLTLTDRDAEAADMLRAAVGPLESARLAAQLYALQLESRQYEAARETLEHCASLAPLADKPFRRWLASQRSELAYHLGNVADAIYHAKLAGPGFFETIAARLEDASRAEADAVLLSVGFVRQHHMTCAPATLSAITRFWRKPADHLEIAEEICYDGTSAYNERNWAESHGWLAREFTVTEKSAEALLKRGVPFTFTTIEPAAAHLQAIIGYDGRRGTFWIRDPFWPNAQEAIADKLLDANHSYGPRGMALVPLEERARFDGLDLPDAALWDRLHQLDAALVGHRRDEAADLCQRLAGEASGHRIGAEARRRLACYDGNPSERLIAVQDLLEMLPDSPCLELERLSCLRELSRRDERMAIYRELCEKRDAHPVFLQQYAQELHTDARRHSEAIALLRRAMRLRPAEAANYYILAGVYWDKRQFEEAFELYRFAACLNDRDEAFAEAYFHAARWCNRTEEAFAFLQRRFERFGQKSGRPVRSLVRACLQWHRAADAVAALDKAVSLRPDDGELLLFAADSYLCCSRANLPLASSLIEKAKGAAPPAQWLRAAARLASQDSRAADALECWRQLLQFQPQAADAHAAIAQLLAQTEGKASALLHLSRALEQFPHHLPLHHLRLEWVRGEPPEVREAAIRMAISISPHDAWLRRELGFFLRESRRLDEAREEALVAGHLEPSSPAYHFLCAVMHRDSGEMEEAKASLRSAIQLCVDYTNAIHELIRLCATAEQRREVLALVKEELLRQANFGDGLLAFRQEAQGTLDSQQVLATLQEILDTRPDLWHAWSACVRQLLTLDRGDEAWKLASQATERFPLLPRLWLDRAAVCRARQDWQGEHDALETAYQINPDWGEATRLLANCCLRRGQFEQARELLEHAVLQQPLDVSNHVTLAEHLWSAGQRDDAIERIQKAIEIGPEHDQAWNCLKSWASSAGRPALAVETARRLSERRPHDSGSWFRLAEMLEAPNQLDERLAALDRAVAIDPRLVRAYDLRAIALAGAQRWQEAQQACNPPVWGDRPPVELRGRAVWIDAEHGNTAQAIARMRELLAEEPGYWAAWCWLWTWCRDTNDRPGCLAAAEAVVRIAPQYEVSLAYLGEAKRLNNDRPAAYAAFERAFASNPGYEYAGNALFDMQLADGMLNAAETTIATLLRHNQSAAVRARAVQLAARGRVVDIVPSATTADSELATEGAVVGTFQTASWTTTNSTAPTLATRRGRPRPSDNAAEHLRQLCTMPWLDDRPLAVAVKAMVDAGFKRQAEKVLEESLTCEAAHPGVGRQWVQLCISRGRWSCGKRLRALAARGPIGVDAAVVYIEALANAKRRWRFWNFFRRNKDWIRKHSRPWASVGFTMLGFNQHAKMTRWMADWRQRNDLAPWMLINLVEGLRTSRRDAEAAKVSRYALTLAPDRTSANHRLWLAADAVCTCDIGTARQYLSQVAAVELPDHARFLQDLVTAVVEMASAPAAERPRVFAAVRRRLRQAAARNPSLKRGYARRKLYRKCLRLIAEYRGGFAAHLWRAAAWLSS